jgi:hypothetical protein
MTPSAKEIGPPDDWLALSDAERAAVRCRAQDYDPDELEVVALEPVRESIAPLAEADGAKPSAAPTLDEAMELAGRLEPGDRTRLFAWLWQSLPTNFRAAVITYGLENVQLPSEEQAPGAANERPVEPIGPNLWEFLFDPSKISNLYSAPRRFDLATIFVVTAAYSLLFGAMTALDASPVTKVTVGLLVTAVAVAQAFYQHTANPRGVSVVAGAITLTFFLAVLGIALPRLFGDMYFAAVVLVGPIGGAASGYLAGTLVGGVFLVADALRRKLAKPDQPLENQDLSEPNSPNKGETPWTS